MARLDATTVSPVPPEEDRASNEDRGERTGDDTDREREGDVVDNACSEDHQRACREQSSDTGQQ